MSKTNMYSVIGVGAVAAVIAVALFLISASAPYSSPEKSIAAFVQAQSRADLEAMQGPASRAVYRNFVGHFGEAKYNQVRSIYQEAYNQAEPQWEAYRQKAETAAAQEHQKIAQQIDKLGRDAFTALPQDERVKLMDDRARFEDFIFTEGVKALPADARAKVIDPQAFRGNRDLSDFTSRNGFALLPEEDQKALKSPAALSADLTPERMAFLESIGIPQLTAKQREAIAGIPSSELRDAQDFMFRNGHDGAIEFLKNSALSPGASVTNCKYGSEEYQGSLFKGSTARCDFAMTVRGTRIDGIAFLVKQGGAWKIASEYPVLTAVGEAYPPRPVQQQSIEQTSTVAPPPVEQSSPERPVQRPRIPHASWQEVTDPAVVTAERNFFFGWLAGLYASQFLTTLFFTILAVAVFCVIMTINYRRLRQETYLPEWLEGEVPLEEVEISHWWSRVWLRLTNKRIIQVRLSWLFSRRKIFGIALDDIYSVTWRRYINWFLILAGIYLVGRSNPVALLVLMWGLESRILAIRFNTPLAQVPIPWIRGSITSFRRSQFNELARFYKKAQLHLAQVRTQKQLPVPSDVRFIPEEDKDFSWSRVVWLFVAVWLVVAIGQRTLGTHVTLDGLWGGLLLGLPVAAAAQSRRRGVWSGLLGAAIFIAVKLPGSVGLLWLARENDGGDPNWWQYALLVAGAAVIAIVARGLTRVHPAACFAAPLLWLIPIAMMRSALLGEMRTYAICFVAVASSAAFSLVADALLPQPVPSVAQPEYAHA